jgi:plastocyanin
MKKEYFLSILFGIISVYSGCKKSTTIPTLTTSAISNITFTTATSGGDITSDGGASVTGRGVCWNTSTGPTTSNSKSSDSNGTGQFVSNITGLTAGMLYYVRAYATNSAGTAYGNEITFSSEAVQLATLSTTVASSITSSTANSGGNITDDGGSAVTARGVCYGLTANPTVAGSHTTDGTDKGSFVSNLTGLTPSTLYFVRAYATNSSGTAYGNQVSLTTLSSTQGATSDVSIQNMSFVPNSVTVSVNTTVTWTNNDSVTHTVTSDTNLFTSGNIAPGGTFSFTFVTAGTYNYHCSIHTDMLGTVVVQ